jgi:hypothetical protein
MPSDFISYTFGKLIEDIRKILIAGVQGMVNEIIESKLSDIEDIRNRLREIERILNEQKRESVQTEKKEEEKEHPTHQKIEEKSQRCQYEGCNKEAVSRGYCKNHYYQLKRKGLLTNLDKNNTKKLCLVDGCNKYAISKGLCKNHYYQFRRGTIVFENGKYIKKG